MIRIYTIENCPYCSELKEILTTEGVPFTEVDVNLPENDKEYNEVFAVTKSDQVPIVKVKNQLLVPNVSFKTIRGCYEIINDLLSKS